MISKHISAVLVITAILSCSRNMPAASTPATPSPAKTTQASKNVLTGKLNEDILYYVNDYRRSRGLSQLQMLDAASVQAYNHSKSMANGSTTFGHNGFEQRVANLTKTEGHISASAENVAYGELSAKEVVKGWLNSPGHKKNIEGNYALTGIGTYKNRDGVIYFTQIFLRK